MGVIVFDGKVDDAKLPMVQMEFRFDELNFPQIARISPL